MNITAAARALLDLAANSTDADDTALPVSNTYDLLEAMYKQNGLYQRIDDLAQAAGRDDLRNLRNPARRAVEFYVSRVFPGPLPDALPIETDNPAIIEPIQQVWEWSNWARQKQLMIRWFAIFGDSFIKVAAKHEDPDNLKSPVKSVFYQLLKPKYVTEIKTDERGYLTYIRIDTPIKVDGEQMLHTEVWDKAADRFAVWISDKSPDAKLEDLGDPETDMQITAFGIDFVPVAYGRFSDMGDDRGVGCFTSEVEKVNELNLQTTQLHKMIFRYGEPIEVLEGEGTDAAGRPLPPPSIRGRDSDDGYITVGESRMIALPAGWHWIPTVPNINYAAALDIIAAQLKEVEDDMPELAYYKVREMGGDVSGRAIKLLLMDAVDKAMEARYAAEAVIIQADKMALTIGSNAGLFTGVGTYEEGNFNHTFTDRPVISNTEFDNAELAQMWVKTGVPLTVVLERLGWSDAELEALAAAKAEEQAETLAYAEAQIAAAAARQAQPDDAAYPETPPAELTAA